MTQEEAMKILKDFHNKSALFSVRTALDTIIPELKESENEKIRKGIIQYLEQSQFGEEHYQIDDNVVRNYIAWLEKQGEQEPINKVEPKFKVGDWIINNDKRIAFPEQILKIEEYGYITSSGYTSFDKVKTDYHPWTIQDAKDGDVLYSDNDIIVTKAIYNANNPHFISYCSYSIEYNIFQSWERDCWFAEAFVPATKEQRDLLFQKMKEAGYEWDAEKKELKKIEQKSSWSEYDEVGLDDAMWKIEQAMGNLWRVERWLKSIKERMKGE